MNQAYLAGKTIDSMIDLEAELFFPLGILKVILLPWEEES
jgi:hypothetical protein